MRALLRYTALRLAIVAGIGLVIWLIGFRGWLFIVLLAVVLSLPVSYLLLGRQQREVLDWREERKRAKADLRAQLRGEDAEPE